MISNGISSPFLLIMLLLMPGTGMYGAGEEPQSKSLWSVLNRAESKTSAREWPEAARLWDEVVHMNPVRGEFWNRLGEARYHNREYRKAIVAYEKALDLRDGFPSDASYNIARCYAQLGDKEKALKWLERAFDLGLRSLTRARTDHDLKPLHNEARFRELTAMEDVSKLSRDEGWRYDLRLLAREVRRKRYHPFREVSEDDFDARVKQIHTSIPRLTDMQIIIEMMKLMRVVGDGHTMLYAFWERPEFLKTIPVDLQFFQEGLFITAADTRYAGLLGAQVLRFGDRGVGEIMQGLEPVINRDNEMGPKVMGLMHRRGSWLE